MRCWPIFLSLFSVLLLTTCQKLEQVDFPELTINPIDTLSINTFSVSVQVKNHLSQTFDDHGFIWNYSGVPPTLDATEGKRSIGPLQPGEPFSATLVFAPDTAYLLVAFATIGDRIFYSPAFSSTTGTAKITTEAWTYSEGNTIQIAGTLQDLEPGIKAVEHGFCWSTFTPEPTLSNSFINLGIQQDNGAFEHTITGLLNDSTLYYRAYVVLEVGNQLDTLLGETQVFDGDLVNAWTPKAPFPGEPRLDAVSFVIGDYAYVGAGRDKNHNYLSDFWKYDPFLDAWEQIESFPEPTSGNVSGFSINGTGYAGHPFSLFAYAPGSGWTLVDVNFPGNINPFCNFNYDLDPSVRTVNTFVVDNKAYFIIHEESTFVLSALVIEYEPLGNDSMRCLCPPDFIAYLDAVSFSLDSKGYYGYGIKAMNFNGDIHVMAPNEAAPCFSTTLDPIPGLNGIRIAAVGLSMDDTGFIGFGTDNNENNRSDWWAYTSSGGWTRKMDFPGIPRRNAVAFSVRNRVYAGLGTSGGTNAGLTPNLTDFYEYDPD